jgi:hypothetical protein
MILLKIAVFLLNWQDGGKGGGASPTEKIKGLNVRLY